MPDEKYKPWVPIEGIPPELWLEAMHDDLEGLRFLLRGESPTSPLLRVEFGNVVGYRNVNESYRLRTWARYSLDTRETPSLLVVENSRFVRWIVEEAGGVLELDDLTHYAIYTSEDCLDIISRSQPEVRWLT